MCIPLNFSLRGVNIQVGFDVPEGNHIAICDLLTNGTVFVSRLNEVAARFGALLNKFEQITLFIDLCDSL